MTDPLLLVSGASRYPRSDRVGDLVVPSAGNRTLPLVPGRWAMDNEAFSGFDEGAFMRMLERHTDRPGCLFVTAPDVVADASATLARWPFWSRVIRGLGFPAAFVAQDGLALADVPWAELGALFIGGSTAFKEGRVAGTICSYAKARGVWVHWGRVNSRRRLRLALGVGVDSIDGSGFSLAPDINIPKAAQWAREIRAQGELRW